MRQISPSVWLIIILLVPLSPTPKGQYRIREPNAKYSRLPYLRFVQVPNTTRKVCWEVPLPDLLPRTHQHNMTVAEIELPTSLLLSVSTLAPVPTPTPMHATAQNTTHGDNHFEPASFPTASMVRNQQADETAFFSGPGGHLGLWSAVAPSTGGLGKKGVNLGGQR